MKKAVLLMILLAGAGIVTGQRSYGHKCAPGLTIDSTSLQPESYALVVADFKVFKESILAQGAKIEGEFPPSNILIVKVAPLDLAAKILQRPDVLFVDRANRTPKEELPVPGHNLFVNSIHLAHTRFPGLNGASSVISIKENRFDTADVDFKNRSGEAPGVAQTITAHANIMATLAAGAGNSDPSGLGVARGAQMYSTGFNNLLPDTDYEALGISVQNHSYGVDVENYYGAGALAYDKSVELNPQLLHVFSAGNEGLQTSPTGNYVNVPGFANLTGNFKMAKNVLTVGAVDSFVQMAPFSSRGPAYDGRIKPDLVAFGQDGTSGSAALVSGSAAVLQQAIEEQSDSLPAAALVRAVLLCSADDINTPGPDFYSGYGNLNLSEALLLVADQQYAIGAVAATETRTFQIDLPANVAEVKITLVWDDPPASPNAAKALVNDLNLLVTDPDGQEWQPWILNAAPHQDSLRQPVRRGRDTLNNAEQVTLELPKPGTYKIRVAGADVQTGWQSFALAWHWQKEADFGWKFPVRHAPVVSGTDALLRWKNTFADTIGKLEYRQVGDLDWILVDSSVDIRKGWYRWQVPEIFAEARLRMHVDGIPFETDTFLIAGTLRMELGFNCPDSVFLFWNSLGLNCRYLLSGLEANYLEPLKILTDTFVVLQKSEFSQTRFAVTPLGEDEVKGARSPAPDIGSQGVGCYVQNFLAILNADFQTELRLGIGTRHGLKSIALEKLEPDGIRTIQSWQPVEQEEFAALDEFPNPGVNLYQARLEMIDGAVLFSDTATVYFLNQEFVLVFPNPAQNNRISVLVNSASEATFVLYDALGRLILEVIADEFPEQIELPAGIPKGFYPFFIRENGRLRAGGVLQAGY